MFLAREYRWKLKINAPTTKTMDFNTNIENSSKAWKWDDHLKNVQYAL